MGKVNISSNEVEKISRLAKLKLNQQQITKLSHELSEILNYVETLGEVDTSQTIPLYQVNDQQNVFNDFADQPLSVELATSQSGNVYKNFFVVDVVIDQS